MWSYNRRKIIFDILIVEETKEGLISARATYTNYELLNLSKIAHAGSPIFMLLVLGYVFKIRIIFLEDSNYLKEKLEHLFSLNRIILSDTKWRSK